MRLSPLDIEHMEFPRGAGGYQRRHVRDFLERVASEVEELLHDMQRLQTELDVARARIGELQTAEAELQRAVLAAERIGNEIKESARREAKLILDEAESLRERRVASLDSEVEQARNDLERLERDRHLFREQFRGLLAAYLRSLDATGGRGRGDQTAGDETSSDGSAEVDADVTATAKGESLEAAAALPRA